jgi:excisionase family DNA binding protein
MNPELRALSLEDRGANAGRPGGLRRVLLSVNEAAQYLGISTGTMRNWLSMRRIEYVKVGRLTRVSQSALDRYIAANTVRAEGDA